MKRLAIAFFYDPEGIVDEYYLYLLRAMRPHVARLVVVVNGTLELASQAALEQAADTLLVRPNDGYDVWAYKEGLDHVGWPMLGVYDEVLLFNHTFYGPLYPLDEMFGAMAERDCDFWGMTAHKAVPADPATNGEALPFHLNSHFIAVRRRMTMARAFIAYWADLPAIPSYEASIRLHELVFTAHFRSQGFAVSTYVDPASFASPYNAFMEMDEGLLRARSPMIKRRAFFHDPTFVQNHGVDLPRALRIIAETSDYPVGLIWGNIVRATNARTLHANAGLMSVLPDEPSLKPGPAGPPPRIALCVHAFYDDLVPEILEAARAIPGPFDLVVTTDTVAKKARIEAMAAIQPGIRKTIVRVTQSRGRDMAALLISCQELLTDGRYDLVCRVHTKKAPQVEASLGQSFKRHTLGNVLPGRAGVAAILDLFAANTRLGLVMPPMIHIGYPTFGHSWFINRDRAEAVAARLGIRVPFDDFSPVAPYGGMFWFRPAALRRLFAGWTWEEFEGEPHPIDGTLAHALERLLVYAAMTDGYAFTTAMTASQVGRNYTALEFKHTLVTGLLPSGDLGAQTRVLARNRDALWQSHRSGKPCLAPQEGTHIRDVTARQVAVARAAAAAAELHAEAASAAMRRLEANTAALLADAAGGPVATRLKAETERLARFYDAVTATPGAATRDRERIARYVLSHHACGRLVPLFDDAWYRALCPATARGEATPLDHFIRTGWQAGLSPHPLFYTAFYRATRPDRAQAADVPLLGYLRDGAPARDTPHPLFDPLHYAKQLDDPASVPDLLLHHLIDPAGRLTDPHPLFDTAAYLRQCPGGPAGGRVALADFIAGGWRENRNPHPLFDTAYYLAGEPRLEGPEDDPLSHYIRQGWREGRDPHPLFDTSYYLAVNGDVRFADINPLVHFVLYGAPEGRNPHGYFDMDFYRTTYPDVALEGTNPLIDYLARGGRGERHPSRAFNARAYLDEHADVRSEGLDPLVHFVRWGRKEHRRIRAL